MLWQQCLQQLEHHFPEQEVNTWLRTLHPQQQDKVLFLLAPNPFVLQHVHENYIGQVVNIIRSLTGDPNYQVMLQIGTGDTAPPIVDTLSSTVSGLAGHQPQITEGYSASPQPEPTPPPIIESASSALFVGNISPKMVFDNFIEGKSNQLARAASLKVSEHIGATYNPLFIY